MPHIPAASCAIALLCAVGTPMALGPAPTAPTGQGAAPACRTGVATYRIVTAAGAFTSTIEGSCTFDATALEGTCTNTYSDSQGSRFTTTSVTRHASRGDVVDEVAVIPPRNLARSTTTTVTGPAASTGTSTNRYDAQRRLVETTSVSKSAANQTTSTVTYTAWDAAGRPTAGTLAAGGQSTPQAFRYDNATRTQTSTSGGIACTQTFNPHGNPARGSCANGPTTATTVLTTQQICR